MGIYIGANKIVMDYNIIDKTTYLAKERKLKKSFYREETRLIKQLPKEHKEKYLLKKKSYY